MNNLTYNEFKVLREILKKGYYSQKEIAEEIGVSVGSVNKIIKNLHEAGLLKDNNITSAGIQSLEPYRVNNAIILAAGKSSRLLPITYELPKGLIVANGERLIERIIRQLHESNINNITVVVGYMAEKYLYLIEKYGIRLIANTEYEKKNNYMSLYFAREDLNNSYICNTDNYYKTSPFNEYEYHSYFTVEYVEESNEARGIDFDSNGLIHSTNKPAKRQWATTGHAYLTHEFTIAFVPLLEKYAYAVGKENYSWEAVYAENLKNFKIYAHKCSNDLVKEFNTLQDLYDFDMHYMLSNDFEVIDNISSVLNCSPEHIKGFDRMLGGLTNDSFRFEVNGIKYVYRRAGENSGLIVNREREAAVTKIVTDLGIDRTVLYVDKVKGWKISKYFNEIKKINFRYNGEDHLKGLIEKLHELHDDIHLCGYQFNLYDEALNILNLIKGIDYTAYEMLKEYLDEIRLINSFLITDQWPISLCHNDAKSNLCIADDGYKLIDWEYAGDTDIGFDLCKLYSERNPKIEEIKSVLQLYYNREPSFNEVRHIIGCIAVCDFYWFIWNTWQTKMGKNLLHDSLFHFQRMCSYKKVAIDLFNYGEDSKYYKGERKE